jgi:regulator of protease activity HflC (stomatin/prohibitin superfamily)
MSDRVVLTGEAKPMIREIERRTANGLPVLLLPLVVIPAVIALVATTGRDAPGRTVIAVILLIVGTIVALFGLMNIAPNEARVLQLFGRYVGTAKENGLRWVNPFYTKRKVSQRVRNFESAKLKVNDHDGSPIEIAAVVVWRVIDTAEALFEVDDYQNYVHVQSEAALRNLATQYPYDDHTEVDHAVATANVAAAAGGTAQAEAATPQPMSLRGSTAAIAEQLRGEVRDRLAEAGVEVIEARISHLAYAPEIAGAMLRRQQAGAVIAARQKIVEGAVGMVDMALTLLTTKGVVEMDDERKAAMVSNLLVVLCAEQQAQPVVNAGTIYH